MHHADRGGICIKYTIFRLILVANRKEKEDLITALRPCITISIDDVNKIFS